MSEPKRLRTISGFARVLPYVWPHRRKLFLSFFFALLVAVFWSVNLSAAFPIVKVLIQGQSLGEYVAAEITSAELQIEKRNRSIKQIDVATRELEESEQPDDETRVGLLKDRSRQQSRLSTASRKLLIMNWIQSYMLRWLPDDQFDLLALIFGFLLVAMLLKGICVFVQEVLIGNVVELTMMSVRKQCFRHVLSLDYQTLRLSGSADLTSRFTHDLQMLAYGLKLMGGKVVREPLKAAACIIGAFLLCWQLTLLAFLLVPLAVFVFYTIGRKLKLASRRMMESMSRIYKTLEETLDAIKVVIAFNGGRKHRQRFHRDNMEYYSKSRRIISIDAVTSPTTEMLGMLTAFIALLPGAYLVLRQTTKIWGVTLSSHLMDIAELSLLYVLLAGVIDPMRKLSTSYAKFKRGSAAADRIFELLDKESLVSEPEHPQPFPRHQAAIEFRRVEFCYATAHDDGLPRQPVLNDVNLTIDAGEVVVVVGENGSGKSTLVNLLPRFYDPGHGEVLIDGVNIRSVRLRDLRDQISVVTQETLLFDETIAENIRYGKTGATDAEVEEAARKAFVTDFVGQLPEGFDTRVGEKGTRLSGGQRQRIALARALLRDPAILILDEATSAIDAQSEKLIHRSLREFSQGRTTFIITHSVSREILDFVSRIVVMDQGQLAAVGSHAELIANCEVYRRLYRADIEQRTESAKPVTASPSPPDSGGSSNDSQAQPVDGPGLPHILPLRRPNLEGNAATDPPIRRTDGTGR